MEKPVNIMHIVFSLQCGGLERVAINLAKSFNNDKYNSCICCLDTIGELKTELPEGIDVFLVKRKQGKDFLLAFKLANEIKKRKISLVHTHNMGPLLYGTLASKLVGIPMINTRHGRENKSCHSLIWDFNKYIVAISNDAKKELLSCNKINTNKVNVIYNGIDIEKYSADKKNNISSKKSLGVQDSDIVIGTVARLSEEKDQITLIDAFSKINSQVRIKLVIAGDGPCKQKLQDHVEKLNLSEKVMFLGFRNDIPNILKALDIFVLSSLTEGISLTLLEAMAANLPIVATDVGGNPEVVEDGLTGFLVPSKSCDEMAKKIEDLISNEKLIQMMGMAGRKRVEDKFSLNSMVRKYDTLYMDCIE